MKQYTFKESVIADSWRRKDFEDNITAFFPPAFQPINQLYTIEYKMFDNKFNLEPRKNIERQLYKRR